MSIFNLDVSKGIFGRGAIPDYPIIPTFEEYINSTDNAKGSLELIQQ